MVPAPEQVIREIKRTSAIPRAGGNALKIDRSMDYELQHCTRHCAASGRELQPGEWYYSVLTDDGSDLKRHDYSIEAWQGPPEDALGWWKAQVPDLHSKKKHWAPNDVMLHFFDELADQPDRQDMRYVLALLLVRRRVMRVEEEEYDEQGRQFAVLYCTRRDTTYRVPVVVPDESRVEAIQEELARLLE